MTLLKTPPSTDPIIPANIIASGLKVKEYVGTVNPTADNDDKDTAQIGMGFRVGYQWLNTDSNTLYVCTDNTNGSAVWLEVNTGGATPYSQVVTVAISGGDFTSLKAALASITDATSLKPYLIQVYPGVFVEDNPVQCKSNVDIVGVGDSFTATIKAQNTDENILVLPSQCGIKNLALTGSTTKAAIYYNVAGLCKLESLYIYDCKYALQVAHASAVLYANYLGVNTVSSNFTTIIYVTAGDLILDSIRVMSGAIAGNLMYAAGTSSIILAIGTMIDSTHLTNGCYANNGAHIVMNGGIFSSVTNVIRIGSAGSNTIMIASNVSIRDSGDYDVLIESSTGYLHAFNTSCDRDKMSIASGAHYDASGHDRSLDVYRYQTDLMVGRDDSGDMLSVGEGGSYEVHSKVVSYDGSSYADVTSSTAISFPNLLTNTALYFGNINPYKFFGLSYVMGDTQLAGGSIVWEYYDSGTSSWLAFNIMATINGHSDSLKSDPFQNATNSDTISLRTDQDIKTGVLESNSSATGWGTTTVNSDLGYWIRCRIDTNITTSMKISSIRLKGNYTSIRSNGTISHSGEARALITDQFMTGASGGTTGNGNYDISPNITYPGRENLFANGANDSAYFQFQIPENIDTSCGLIVYIDWKTSEAPSGADQTAKLHLYSAILAFSEIDTVDMHYDGTNTDNEIQMDFIAEDGDLANKVHREVIPRIDLSDHKAYDMIYFRLNRESNEAGDDLTNSVIHSGITFQYRKWQDGANFL